MLRRNRPKPLPTNVVSDNPNFVSPVQPWVVLVGGLEQKRPGGPVVHNADTETQYPPEMEPVLELLATPRERGLADELLGAEAVDQFLADGLIVQFDTEDAERNRRQLEGLSFAYWGIQVGWLGEEGGAKAIAVDRHSPTTGLGASDERIIELTVGGMSLTAALDITIEEQDLPAEYMFRFAPHQFSLLVAAGCGAFDRVQEPKL